MSSNVHNGHFNLELDQTTKYKCRGASINGDTTFAKKDLFASGGFGNKYGARARLEPNALENSTTLNKRRGHESTASKPTPNARQRESTSAPCSVGIRVYSFYVVLCCFSSLPWLLCTRTALTHGRRIVPLQLTFNLRTLQEGIS